MSRKDFLVFGSPLIGREEIDEVVACLESGWIGTGPRVARLEADFAAYKGVRHAAAVNSCSAALHLSMLAAGLGPGDEVVTTPLTFCATVNAIIHAGCTPVLADVEPDSMNLDPAAAAAALTGKGRALLPVHFAGRPCDMEAITALAQSRELLLIEDCAHAVETQYKGRQAGTFGDFGCFSFYVTKNVACGEGGMVLARDEERIGRVKTLALHGMSKDAWRRFSDQGYQHYFVTECGFKYNMMDLQAAVGLHQLARVQANWERRRQIWGFYDEAFADLPLELPAPLKNPRWTALLHQGQTLTYEEYASALPGDKRLASVVFERPAKKKDTLKNPRWPALRSLVRRRDCVASRANPHV